MNRVPLAERMRPKTLNEVIGQDQIIGNGKILTERHGDGGFGYDPLFYYEPFGKTFAEVELSKKNEVSHRAIAIKQFVKKLKQVLNDK